MQSCRSYYEVNKFLVEKNLRKCGRLLVRKKKARRAELRVLISNIRLIGASGWQSMTVESVIEVAKGMLSEDKLEDEGDKYYLRDSCFQSMERGEGDAWERCALEVIESEVWERGLVFIVDLWLGVQFIRCGGLGWGSGRLLHFVCFVAGCTGCTATRSVTGRGQAGRRWVSSQWIHLPARLLLSLRVRLRTRVRASLLGAGGVLNDALRFGEIQAWLFELV